MKLSTRKILGLELVLVVAMLVLALLPMAGVLREYLQVAVLVAIVACSIILFGWAKPRSREVKLVAITVLLATVVFEVAYWVLLGMKCGFVTNIYGWNWLSLVQVFLPITAIFGLMEIFRGQMIERGKGSKVAIVVTTLALIFVETLLVLPTYNLTMARGWFDLAVTVFGSAVMNNVLLTYIAYLYDYRMGLTYRLITTLPFYMMPLLPDVNQYLRALFQTLLTVALTLSLVSWQKLNGRQGVAATVEKLRQAKKRPFTEREQRLRQFTKRAAGGLLFVAIVAYTALMSGLFKYHFLAIGSGSMSPELERGDMILVKKSRDYDKIDEGDILVYRHSNTTIVHRVAEIIYRDDKYYYKTQGDANASADAWEVEQGDVIGVAKGKIIAFGFPTLWLNELFNGGKI